MKDAIRGIVGKKITGVIVKEREARNPLSQVYIIFSDDTYYELYCPNSTICGIGGVDKGAERLKEGDGEIILEEYAGIPLRKDKRYEGAEHFHPKTGAPLLEPYTESKGNVRVVSKLFVKE